MQQLFEGAFVQRDFFPNSLSLQGSIQQLVIKDDPRTAEEQCEDDDPYVRNTHTHTHTESTPNTVLLTMYKLKHVHNQTCTLFFQNFELNCLFQSVIQ